MDHIIEFPQSEKQIQENILHGIETKDKEQVITNAEILKNQFPSLENMVFLAEALMEVDLEKQAQSYLKSYSLTNYLNQAYLQTIVKVLAKNFEFERASSYLEEYKQLYGPTDQVLQVDQYLTEKNEQVQKERQAYKKKVLDQMYSLMSGRLADQLAIVKKSQILEENQLIELGNFLLSIPKLHQIVRASFLDILIQKKVDHEFAFLWLGEKLIINPRKAKSLETLTIVEELKEKIYKTFEKNPSLYQIVLQELNFDLLLLHPRVSEMIDNPDSWLRLYSHKYLSTVLGEGKVDARYRKLKERLDAELSRLTD